MAEETKMSCSAAILYALITTPLTVMLRGWTLQTLWAWFVAGVFGVQMLSVPQAIGLSLLLSFATLQISPRDLKPDHDGVTWERTIFGTVLSVLACGFALAGGWIVHHFWM
jgi:hypothetical protein